VRVVVWRKDDPFGVEYAEVTLFRDRLSAVGVAVGADPVAYRLDYTLETGRGFVTSRLRVTARGEGWRRMVDLRRAASGAWAIETAIVGEGALVPPGGEMDALAGAVDCDLGLSPLTNTMPVLREDLRRGGTATFRMAWVSVPDLGVHPSAQRYTFLRALDDGRWVVRFESIDDTFTADLTFDADGLIVDYPGLARRVP
jgi:hypothetical protein